MKEGSYFLGGEKGEKCDKILEQKVAQFWYKSKPLMTLKSSLNRNKSPIWSQWSRLSQRRRRTLPKACLHRVEIISWSL